jgi:Zn-dependent peptidase ImmA (M78 family)/transcriptional regulator with XRE-family HTH domain
MIGTVGFVGGRLREAREARALTAIALAELLGVSPMAISQFENNKHSPRPDLMKQIAEKLNLPEQFFKRQLEAEDKNEAVFWRSFSSATKAARGRCKRRFVWFKQTVQYLEGFFDFPAINVPLLDLSGSDILTLDADFIEETAARCRQMWGLNDGPIADVLLQMENNGIIATRTRLDADTLDAFSQWDRFPYVVLGSDKKNAVRSRYDAAHELGHLILHRNVSENFVAAAAPHSAIERSAFRFAAAFLLPAQSFVNDLWAPTLDAFRSLKQRWKVSIGVMIHRCADLDLINEAQAKSLWINYNRRGWRREEPLDNELPVESPRLIRRCFETLVNQGMCLKEQILLDLPFSPRDIEAFGGLPSGYFDSDFGDVIAMPQTKRPRSAAEKPGKVLPFVRH